MTAALAFLLVGTLFDQSMEKLLDREVPNQQVSYAVLDNTSGNVIAQRWPGIEHAVPVGSLVKPFVALAALHSGTFPVLTCDPKQCWLRKGHGTIGIAAAVAHSCNSYFLQLARQADPDFLRRFGLDAPPAGASAETWIGLGREWKLTPLALARAYLMLATYPEAEPIRQGMAESARSGTGRAFGAQALVKTGTAACSHPADQPGDGYVVGVTARYTLLVQMHGVPGATAAATGGRMMRTILRGN